MRNYRVTLTKEHLIIYLQKEMLGDQNMKNVSFIIDILRRVQIRWNGSS